MDLMNLTLVDLFSVLIYIISFFGSISFGYLILRFNIPDIRIIPRELKLGLSGILGVAIFGLSIGGSFFINLSFLLFTPLWTLIFAALFYLYEMLTPKTEMSIAIPVAKVETPEPKEKRVVVRPAYAAPKVLEEREIADRGAIARESYSQPARESMIVERTEVQERPEIQPREEEQYIQKARERYMQRQPQKGPEIQYEEKLTPSPEINYQEKPKETSDRRRRYAERRGELIEEAKTDMFRASETKEREKAEKELFKESAPSSELSLDELSEGLDIGELDKITSLDELGGFEELGGMSDKDLELLSNLAGEEKLAGLAESGKIPKEKGMGCPKCNSQNSSVVYCPYCGKGFCSNCSDKIQRKGELIFYGCPTCKKEVIVKSES